MRANIPILASKAVADDKTTHLASVLQLGAYLGTTDRTHERQLPQGRYIEPFKVSWFMRAPFCKRLRI